MILALRFKSAVKLFFRSSPIFENKLVEAKYFVWACIVHAF